WPLDGQEGKSIDLPNSDLHATLRRVAGREGLYIAEFHVRRGDGPELVHYGWSNLPMVPSLIPGKSAPEGKEEDPNAQQLARIAFFYPQPAGMMGTIEVAGLPDGSLYYRTFDRKGFKTSGALKTSERVQAFGGGDSSKMPMSLAFQVERY